MDSCPNENQLFARAIMHAQLRKHPMPDRQFSVKLRAPVADTILKLAKLSGMTTHRYLQEVLAATAKQAVVFRSGDLPSCDTRELTRDDARQIQLALPVPLAMRLQETARALKAAGTASSSTTWLAKHILQHFAGEPSDIMRRIAGVDITQLSPMPLVVNTRIVGAARRPAAFVTVHVHSSIRGTLHELANAKGTTLTALARKILDKALPQMPAGTETTPER